MRILNKTLEVLPPTPVPLAGCANDAALRDLTARVSALEQAHVLMCTAFTLDDLGRPAFDEHRQGHKAEKAARERLEGYKQDAAKKLIGIAIAALLSLLLLGAGAWLQGRAP